MDKYHDKSNPHIVKLVQNVTNATFTKVVQSIYWYIIMKSLSIKILLFEVMFCSDVEIPGPYLAIHGFKCGPNLLTLGIGPVGQYIDNGLLVCAYKYTI